MNGNKNTRCAGRRRVLSDFSWRTAAILSALLLSDAVAFGQGQNDPLKVQRGAQGPVQAPPVVQQQQQPFYVQAAVVVLLTGGAVWAVCHSSRRQ